MTESKRSQSYTLLLQGDVAAGRPFQEVAGRSPLPTQTAEGAAAAPPTDPAALDKLYKKISKRLIPLLMLITGLNYLDRSSLAFASIQMTADLDFSPSVYGLAGGLFFLSYCCMQVPSNVCCMKFGVQKWMSSIMLVWGAVAATFAAVRHPWQFYLLRLLLGAAEAGSFPGTWYAISLFYPPHRTSVPYAMQAVAVAISQALAAPLAAALLKLDGLVAGLTGWQILFIAEGVPSVLLGIALPWLLPNGPEDAAASGFLDSAELQMLQADMAVKPVLAEPRPDVFSTARDVIPAGQSASSGSHRPALPSLKLLMRVMRVWQIWYLAACTVLEQVAQMALMLWLPVMVHSLLSGADPTELAATAHSSSKSGAAAAGHGSGRSADTGTTSVLLTALPFTAAAAATTWVGRHAQRSGETLMYIIVLNMLGGVSFIAFHWVVHANRAAGFVCLVITMACAYAASPHALTVITKLTAGTGAVGIALPAFNSVAMLGGFLGPTIMGFVAERLGGFNAATVIMGVCMMLAALLVAGLRVVMMRDPVTRACVSGTHSLSTTPGSCELAPGFDLVYRSTSSPTRGATRRVPVLKQPSSSQKQRRGKEGISSSSSDDGGDVAAEPRTALLSSDSLVKRTASSSRRPALPGQPRVVTEIEAAVMMQQDVPLRRLPASAGGSRGARSSSSSGDAEH